MTANTHFFSRFAVSLKKKKKKRSEFSHPFYTYAYIVIARVLDFQTIATPKFRST